MMLGVFLTSFLNGQVEVYIGTYGSSGYPDYIVGRDVLTSEFLGRIGAAVPEGYPVPQYHPSYLTNNFSANVKVTEKTELFMSFVQEGTGYKNVVGYYKYPTDNPPTQRNDIDTLYIAFPNFSAQNSGGSLVAGDKVSLREFEAGITVAFFLKANAYNSSSNTVGSGQWTHFSDKILNNDLVSDNSLNQHTIVLYDQQMDKYVVGFEDITRPGGDKDFNDAIFYITSSVVSAVETEDIAGLPVVWERTVDSDWNNPLNWRPNIAPDSTSNISISSSAVNDPIVSEDIDISAITVDPGASLSFTEEAVVYIEGDVTDVTSGLTDVSIVLDGDKPQYVFGNPEFTDLTVDSSDTVFIEEGMTVVENLTVKDGVLVTNDNLTVVNENSYTTSLIESESGEIDGKITIRTVIPAPDGYHYITSPLLNQTLADINDDYSLVGLGGDFSTTPFPNIWIYDETVSSNFYQVDGWVTPPDLSYEMSLGEGFAFNVDEGTVLEITGEPFKGSLSMDLSYTYVEYNGHDRTHCPPEGWHLIGNPYPAVIDWDKVILQNVENAVYSWDHNYHRYATYIDGVGVNGGSNYIAAMQGFFIRATYSSDGLQQRITFADSMKVSSLESQSVFRSNDKKYLKFSLNGPVGSDEFILRFNEFYSDEFDEGKDAYKINSTNTEIPNISAVTQQGLHLSINSMTFNLTDTIDLYIEASVTGIHELKIEEFKEDIDEVFLLNKNTGVLQSLYGESAFLELQYREIYENYAIVFQSKDPSSVKQLVNQFSFSISGNTVQTISSENVKCHQAKVVDISGKMVFLQGLNIEGNEVVFNLDDCNSVVYILMLDTSKGSITRKIVLTNR